MSAPASTARARVRAPELVGRRWIGTGGRDLTLADLRGKIVLLDFWTSCCVNCQHVLEELREVEAAFGDVLVVVGVHSPKFAFEGTVEAVDAAVRRWEVHHPVLDDPELHSWQAYAARAWPTLVVIDPTGYVVASMSGEGHAHGLTVLISELVDAHRAAGTLRVGDGPYVPPPPQASALAYPSGVLALPQRLGGGLLVADTGHHQLVVLEDDLVTERLRIGSGERGPLAGPLDGTHRTARFTEPAGLALLPADVAARLGYDVVVADSVGHAVRGVRLEAAGGSVVTIAGTGQQLRERAGGGPALAQPISTPQALAWFDDRLVIAMAGTHQLWALDPGAGEHPDPADGVLSLIAGTSAEGVLDGDAAQAHFAQTSALAPTADGSGLWVLDAESSALRWLTAQAGGGYRIDTLVGTGLFAFGFRDGPAGQALMQHPLGVAVLPDGSVAIADTYNGAVRRYDPVSGAVSTLARGLAEPAALLVEQGPGGAGDGATLVVVESAASRLVRLPVPVAAQQVRGPAQQVRRPPTPLPHGAVRLRVAFTPPTGQKLDDRWGDPTRLVVSASPPELLADGAGDAQGLARELVLARPGTGAAEGVLHVSVQAAACDGDPVTGQVPDHAACHLYQQDWGIPVVLDPGAPAELTLDLRGV